MLFSVNNQPVSPVGDKNFSTRSESQSDFKKSDKTVIAIQNEITPRLKRSFPAFVAGIDTLLYLDNMIESDRYTLEDIKTWDYKKNLNAGMSRIIEKRKWLEKIYRDILSQSITDEKIDAIIDRYQTWFYVLLKRIYKKYFDSEYEIEGSNDGEGDSANHIFM
jgi:hypothetical protein